MLAIEEAKFVPYEASPQQSLVPMVSIVVPAYNEEQLIGPLLDELRTLALHVDGPVEIIVSENGSSDRTRDIVSMYEDDVQLICNQTPGYGPALIRGIRAANGRYIVVINADLWSRDFFFASLERLISGDDVVVGSKRFHRGLDRRHASRKLICAAFNALLRSAFGFRGTDTHGIKAFDRDAVLPIVDRCVTNREIFDTELILRCQRSGLEISELPCAVEDLRPPRMTLLRRVIPTAVDLIRVWCSLNISNSSAGA